MRAGEHTRPRSSNSYIALLDFKTFMYAFLVPDSRSVADLGGVRGVQMHPPLAASNVFCVHK